MAFKRSFSNRVGGNAGSSSGEETVIELDKKKQVTIRKFNNINLVDIREFYIDKDGERKPGKKGISLTEDTWYKLLENTNKIQNALDVLNGQVPKSATPSKQEKPTKKQKVENSDDEEEFEDVDISKKPKPKAPAKQDQEEESDADD